MSRPVTVRRWRGAKCSVESDSVTVEEPLEIRVNDLPVAVMMRTPGLDEALAVGFLVTDSILHSPEALHDVARCPDSAQPEVRNTVTVYTAPAKALEMPHDVRRRYSSSSCGLCGKATIEQALRVSPPLESSVIVSRSVLMRLPGRLLAQQGIFDKTGGLHAAGLFSLSGELQFAAEDIGRHNAVDKVVGLALLSGRWPLSETILMVSGRIGFEIAQKALAARIPAVCAISAPSTLASDLARKAGMILVGFLRGDSMNAYAGEERIVP